MAVSLAWLASAHVQFSFVGSGPMSINVDFELSVACPVGACLVPRETGYDAALMGGRPRDSQEVACWRALLVVPAVSLVAVSKIFCVF